MVTITSFYPYVLPHVVGCPDPVMDQAIRSACIEFCAQTLLVQEVTTVSVVSGVQDYDIEVPSGMGLSKVIGVLLEDQWLTPNSIESVRSGLALRGSVGSAVVAQSTPRVYFQKTPTAAEISLYPVPADSVIEGLAMRAAFTPLRNAITVADVLYQNYAEDIGAGAISRLMLMPGQVYSDLQSAGIHRAKFDNAIKKASIIARTGQVAVASRVQLTQFA